MNTPPVMGRQRRHGPQCLRLAACSLLLLAAGCSALRPEAAPATPSFYALDPLPRAASLGAPQPPAGVAGPQRSAAAPTLVVNPPRAVAGFDSQRIIYVRRPHTLEYFAHSEWTDTPARMLAPLMVSAIERSGAFRAVASAPSSAGGALRLDTDLVVLQQEFSSQPSQVRFALRAYVVEDGTRRVVASRFFEATAAAPTDDPYGGVVAANQVVQAVLKDLSAFCADAAGQWQAQQPASSGGVVRR